MNIHAQAFIAPDGTPMIILPAEDFERLLALSEDTDDLAAAQAALAGLKAGVGTMPGEVLDLILDNAMTPVAAWRRYRRLSQAELARRAGLSQVFVSKIERGESHGTPKTRKSLAVALDAPLWSLEDETLFGEGDSATSVQQKILSVLKGGDERSARSIATSIFGSKAQQSRVNQDCGLLVKQNKLIRSGQGGQNDPFRYRLAE